LRGIAAKLHGYHTTGNPESIRIRRDKPQISGHERPCSGTRDRMDNETRVQETVQLDPDKLAQLRSMPTSNLLILMTSARMSGIWWFGPGWYGNPTVMADEYERMMVPALAAVTDEINRRIPVPT
jgi:hypothetical protein